MQVTLEDSQNGWVSAEPMSLSSDAAICDASTKPVKAAQRGEIILAADNVRELMER